MKVNRFEAAGFKCIEVAPENSTGRELPLVVVLHGRGDRGDSFIDVPALINPTDYRFVFPTAGLPLPGAYFEWFRFDSLNIGPKATLARVGVTKLLDELRGRFNTTAGRTALAGFSQGGMMTLDVGLRYPQKLAGLVALSSFLVADAPFSWANPGDAQAYYGRDPKLKSVLATAAAQKVPVFIGHGIYDPVVPVLAGRATRDLLQGAGLPVEYYEFQGGHEFSRDELAKVKAFLSRVL